jgi:YidC/Oxa1 family membrane protein insertase
MEQRPNDRMLERTLLFVALAIGVLLFHSWITGLMRPPQKPAPAEQQVGEAPKDANGELVAAKPEDEAAKPADEAAAEPSDEPSEETPIVAEPIKVPDQYVTLGSADPQSRYRMLVTLTNRGAAVVRTELNSPRYRDIEDRSGYLGHLVVDTSIRGEGCPVQVVGKGTPAQKAGLRPGDLITSLAGVPVTGARSLTLALQTTRPGQIVPVEVQRLDEPLEVKLGWRPLEVMRPEGDDPLSFLVTLHQIDSATLPDLDLEALKEIHNDKSQVTVPRDKAVDAELDGVSLRDENWEVVKDAEDVVEFRRTLPKYGLEVTKVYRLVETSTESEEDVDYPAYHLKFEVRVRNVGKKAREVAYQLDGPTGLPTEGYWYANKVGPGWGAYGLRDVLISMNEETPVVKRCVVIAEDDLGTAVQSEENRLTYIGVDAQYFSSILIPQRKAADSHWFSRSHAIRVGPVEKKIARLTNTSCRVVSVPTTLEPDKTISHNYNIFIGPKRPPLLEEYGLRDSVFYGWFWWVAIPMQSLLHTFYSIVFNYGLAIILLTVVVRSCMFPLSRKQALGARKMQELQPEIKKISEKYKKDPEALRHAQQELFRKHNYNPLSGCLPVFIQLPIFIGLYRALMVDVELRGAPLLGTSVRWCSNLAAPDMLFEWREFWTRIGWESFNTGQGILSLGPYFNILPLVTIVLFIVQQKMFMPPPADEQAKMQQNMMNFMMLFMGLIFFKVASGLCIYFIASSLWGVAERQFLPKKEEGQTPAPAAAETTPRTPPPRRGGGPQGRGGQGPRKRPKKKPRKR